ncbi:MAG: phage portal protein [Clostridiales bacterium]|nr:phage portal protein [Clostridiales bacterium]
MDQPFAVRLKNAWNTFLNKDPTEKNSYYSYSSVSSFRPDRPRFTGGNERSIVTALFNRIALDAASVHIVHARLDDNSRMIEVIKSGLNECLTVEANIDQSGRELIQDIVQSMLDEGCVALVPVDTNLNPYKTDGFDILSLRVGKITQWYPLHIKVNLYNERVGKKEEIILPKKMVAIIENPLYSVINEPNSTMKRLIRKLSLLDMTDEHNSSGKLDLIIQLPYVIKNETRKEQAEKRRKDIENQLVGSKYGVAYTDGTERITQLNRPIDNNLMSQIEYLTSMLYSQLGITKAVLEGTASEAELTNYFNRTIEPILSAITDSMIRKFLTKTARTQKQSILFFRDPFKLLPVSNLAEVADKFTRNEIMSSNEFRQIVGLRPSDDPRADKLENKNIRNPNTELPTPEGYEDEEYDAMTEDGDFQNGI